MTKVLDFAEIEQRRASEGIPMAELCRIAGVSYSTYWRIKSFRQEPQWATKVALGGALKTLLRKARKLAR
jgi:hypothetical protein